MITCQQSIPRLDDYAEYFEDLFKLAVDNDVGKLTIPPGKYHLSRPMVLQCPFTTTSKGVVSYRPIYVEAWGAIFDHSVVFDTIGLSVDGMQVRNSPSHGFVIASGQGGSYRRLHSEDNASHGYYFGSDSADPVNSQVTLCHFDSLIAQCNGQDGFHFDGRSQANRNWCNANVFTNAVSRNNVDRGFASTPGGGPDGGISRMNYNTFVGMYSESNGLPCALENLDQTGNAIIGAHLVEVDNGGISLYLDDMNYVFGGRIVGDINRKTESTIFANTATPGEQGRLAYNPGSDL